ncbi:hypothetical protein PHYBLDRAFT_67330 [Phycomyces blakesleeanus NRRL 1555(-)]|uniref:Uncharacterized protein n=1 Tax=Phycomyces blakesleeanus (strain ATCC 8743b / DSM 1359 / FGSC 10004 / NBRC 33097 / NRRL 1555) TaxID=763407 RepID=A0A162N9U5_PHYB8|nr:hypothetical protein PHYBLDRAFT_67330 [Phycomyces blakesleeanus NRRL 1555(-)]OAD67194.1 hypothetical protein PHYBLDRAFT_67330 [Phycomyces blakesleeanus NRRL 1555(-)]|eukprot:XP_018285234.1 hypothetical protein PHYBLDRAFT_67330 [Phycomyces blakesleeanus NRRL 1555(-)]
MSYLCDTLQLAKRKLLLLIHIDVVLQKLNGAFLRCVVAQPLFLVFDALLSGGAALLYHPATFTSENIIQTQNFSALRSMSYIWGFTSFGCLTVGCSGSLIRKMIGCDESSRNEN